MDAFASIIAARELTLATGMGTYGKESMMYRSIMVPLDGSVFSEHALPLALSIARRAGAALQLARPYRN
jgi:hypothetical protein